MYLHAKFRRDKTTSGLRKRTAAYFLFRFRPMHSRRHVVLHPPVKFRSNRTIVGLRVVNVLLGSSLVTVSV